MKKLKVIYQPKGRAREYAELAVNLFETCWHGCEYCYAPKILHKKPVDFFAPTRPRQNIVQKVKSDAQQLKAKDDQREILLCFTSDPYQTDVTENDINRYTTRVVLKELLGANLNITILTKGGLSSLWDLALLEKHKFQVRYGTSLVFSCDHDCKIWEQKAAPTSERIQALKTVHDQGIRTWVSLEPAWSKVDALRLIEKTYPFTDKYMVGKLNYHPHASEVNWSDYVKAVVLKLTHLEKEFYVKEDLRVFLKPRTKAPGKRRFK